MRVTAALWLALAAPLPAAAAPTFAFAKVVDTSTSIPGGSGDFTGFGPPAIEAGVVVFRGEGLSDEGIYRVLGTVPSVEADLATAIPSGTGSFTAFGAEPAVGAGTAVFLGLGSGAQSGVYAANAALVGVVADTATPIPGGTGAFSFFDGALAANGVDVAFRGNGAAAQAGVYADLGVGLAAIADLSTAVPAGTGSFVAFGAVAVDAGAVAFEGIGTTAQDGIYTGVPGSLTAAADTTTAIPGGSGDFTGLLAPAFDNPNVAFVGVGVLGQAGIYKRVGGQLSRVADRTTPIPEGSGSFTTFSQPIGIDGGDVWFVGHGSDDQLGIYAEVAGQLCKVLDVDDTLEAKLIVDLELGRHGVHAGAAAFRVAFDDGSESLYITMLPVPALPLWAVASLVGVLLVASWWGLRR